MPNNYGPRVITDGLRACLDAANIKSYPGTGTLWTDISRTGNNGTLANGPTFNSENGGSIVFDGTNDRVSMSAAINTNSNFSLEFWALRTSDANIGTLISGIDTNAYFVIRMLSSAVSLVRSSVVELGNFGASSATVSNTINHVVVTRSGTTYTCYTNGIFRGTLTFSTTYNTASPALGIYNGANAEPFSGRIYKFAHYDRALSTLEVLQNYNATKGRFKL
jgi:hypothetical protein